MSVEAPVGFGARRRAKNGVDYPVRFFNLLNFDKPDNIRDIFKWSKIFYRSNGLLKDVIDKMARYPITTVEVTGENSAKWDKILNDQLKVREKLVTAGINLGTFGNCFITFIPKFTRYLKCSDPKCEAFKVNQIHKTQYSFHNFKFSGKCNGCGKVVTFKIKDEYKKDPEVSMAEQMNIRIWPTESIYPKWNAVTGDSKIIYKLDASEVKGIQKGERFFLETMPSDFILAVEKFGTRASVELDPQKTIWFKEEDIEEANTSGMGLPFFFAAWKTIWQMFIHRKAQESIVSDHLLPYRVIFPQAMNNVDPISAIDLGQWKNTISGMLQRWYNDPNEIGELPFPVGYQQLGGQGKALSLMTDIHQLNQEFLTEVGVPPELIYGGMSWSGSSVTLRMLENRFMYVVNRNNDFLKAITSFIAGHFEIKAPDDVKLSPFRMADDIAKTNLYLGLAAQGKISYQRALGILGDNVNFEEESKIIEKERAANRRALGAMQSAQAGAAAEASRITNREQVITQIEAQELTNNLSQTLGGNLTDATAILTTDGIIRKLNDLPEDQKAGQLTQMQATQPELYQRVIQGMGLGDPAQQKLPEQKPPRAEGENRRI